MSISEKVVEGAMDEVKESHIIRNFLIWAQKSVVAIIVSFMAGAAVGIIGYNKFFVKQEVPDPKIITEAIENKDYRRGDCLDFGYAMWENYPTIFAEPFTVTQRKNSYSWKNEDEENEKDD